MARKIREVYKITKTLLNKVERLASKGLSLQQIADCLGWSEATIHQKKKDFPELVEAIRKGQTKGVQTVANSLFKRANGYKYNEVHEEIKKDSRGVFSTRKIVRKSIAPDTTAQIFYLTNRDPENWKHKSEQVHSGDVGLVVGKVSKENVERIEKFSKDLAK